MLTDEIKRKLSQYRNNVFVNDAALDHIESLLEAGDLDEREALTQLNHLDPERGHMPFSLTPQQITDEWKSLAGVIVEAENRAKKTASRQFLVGLLGLPLCVAIILFSLFFGWQRGEGAAMVSAIFGICLAAIAGHSFLVLRIHQQASLAAERLSEKRMGILFLRIAAERPAAQDAKRLLEAGTAMFLGHHVAQTIPLQAEDFSALKKLTEKQGPS